jgi:hypothetical protein
MVALPYTAYGGGGSPPQRLALWAYMKNRGVGYGTILSGGCQSGMKIIQAHQYQSHNVFVIITNNTTFFHRHPLLVWSCAAEYIKGRSEACPWPKRDIGIIKRTLAL